MYDEITEKTLQILDKVTPIVELSSNDSNYLKNNLVLEPYYSTKYMNSYIFLHPIVRILET